MLGNFPPEWINLMKTTIVALCFLCASAAFAQNAPVLPNTPQPLQMSDHPQHASEHAMAQESSLLSCSAYSYAQGEVPLAELGSIAPGKLADLVLINGNPAASISDARHTALVMKDGILYRPAELYAELGIQP